MKGSGGMRHGSGDDTETPMTWLNNNDSGVSLIAAVFIIVVLAFMGVMFVSLINTSSFTVVNDMQATQALYVAEGGVEYAQLAVAKNLDWYRSVSDPMPAPASAANQSLGAGTFTVTTNIPATMLRRQLTAGGATATVYTTGQFPSSGYLQIDNIESASVEFVSYNNTSATTFTLNARNVTIGTVSSNNFAHSRGDIVYPVSQLKTVLPNNCNSLSINLTPNSKFLSAGTIMVTSGCVLDACNPNQSEQITYTGSSISGGVMTLTGVTRCVNGTTSIAAAVNDPVTSLQAGLSANLYDYEVVIDSRGTVGSAVREVMKTVRR